MAYKFVTREEIHDIVVADEGGVELRQLALKILSERDAYREVAIEKQRLVWKGDRSMGKQEAQENVDAEAARIMGKK